MDPEVGEANADPTRFWRDKPEIGIILVAYKGVTATGGRKFEKDLTPSSS